VNARRKGFPASRARPCGRIFRYRSYTQRAYDDAMACRRVVTARQMTAARLMVVEGMSAYRALCRAGYASSTARVFGRLLRGSWGLREAIRLTQEQEGRCLVARPVRKRNRYDRRPLALNVRQYVAADIQVLTTNTALLKQYATAKRTDAIAHGRSLLPVRCSLCRSPLEGQDRWCPNCQRCEKSVHT
jgi:hypothetical protein